MAVAVREAEAADVEGFLVFCGDDATQAEVQAVRFQCFEPAREATRFDVLLDCLLAEATGGFLDGFQLHGQVRDGLFQARGDGCEVLLIAGDKGGSGFGG